VRVYFSAGGRGIHQHSVHRECNHDCILIAVLVFVTVHLEKVKVTYLSVFVSHQQEHQQFSLYRCRLLIEKKIKLPAENVERW